MKEFEELITAVVRLSAAEVVRLIDIKRQPVADAAAFLHLKHGFTANWLKARSPEEIRTSAKSVAYNVTSQLLMTPVRFVAGSFGIVTNGELYEPSGDGWSFRLKYPDREATADAALFLWKNQVNGNRAISLGHLNARQIRSWARSRQKLLCEKVAGAAWTCVDSGSWQAHHFIYGDLSNERILEAAKAIKDCQLKRKAEPRKMVGALCLEGWGEHGQRIKVEGIPIYSDSNPLSFDGEFVNEAAKVYRIAEVTSMSTSFGPGVFY